MRNTTHARTQVEVAAEATSEATTGPVLALELVDDGGVPASCISPTLSVKRAVHDWTFTSEQVLSLMRLRDPHGWLVAKRRVAGAAAVPRQQQSQQSEQQSQQQQSQQQSQQQQQQQQQAAAAAAEAPAGFFVPLLGLLLDGAARDVADAGAFASASLRVSLFAYNNVCGVLLYVLGPQTRAALQQHLQQQQQVGAAAVVAAAAAPTPRPSAWLPACGSHHQNRLTSGRDVGRHIQRFMGEVDVLSSERSSPLAAMFCIEADTVQRASGPSFHPPAPTRLEGEVKAQQVALRVLAACVMVAEAEAQLPGGDLCFFPGLDELGQALQEVADTWTRAEEFFLSDNAPSWGGSGSGGGGGSGSGSGRGRGRGRGSGSGRGRGRGGDRARARRIMALTFDPRVRTRPRPLFPRAPPPFDT